MLSLYCTEKVLYITVNQITESEVANMANKNEIVEVITEIDKKNYNQCIEKIGTLLTGVAKSYLMIGVQLKRIRDKKLFNVEGYKNVYELASEKFGMGKTTCGNAINVVERFCTEKGVLKEEYKAFSFTQLVEMLPLEDEQLKDVGEMMSAKEIRELKKDKNDKKEKKENNGSSSSQLENDAEESTVEEIPTLTVEKNLIKALKATGCKEFAELADMLEEYGTITVSIK